MRTQIFQKLTQVTKIVVYHFGVNLLYAVPSSLITDPNITNTAAMRGVGAIIVQVILDKLVSGE